MTVSVPWGRRLAAARVAAGLSCGHVARLCGVSRKTLGLWERMAAPPASVLWLRAARVLRPVFPAPYDVLALGPSADTMPDIGATDIAESPPVPPCTPAPVG